MQIEQILAGQLGPTLNMNPSQAVETSSSISFADLFSDMVEYANQSQLNSERLQAETLAGGELKPGEVQSAIVQAELALETLVAVRNRLVDAFNELRQMQI